MNNLYFLKTMIKKVYFILFALLIFLPYFTQAQDQDTVRWLFIGHCYQLGTNGKKVDYRVEQLDKSVYDGIWLGGDVCSEAMLEYSTVVYIDSLFHLGNPETHWALGNHDARNGNWNWYTELSGRKTYYTYSSYGVTRIILNTNLVPTECEMLDEQFEIINKVCDTIQQSKYLILLMHHGIWRGVPGIPNPGTFAQSDLIYWNATCKDVNSTFAHSIYPRLKEVQQRGIQVICILGDMGAQDKTFDKLSDDGVRFLACGLYHNEPEDMVLELDLAKQSHTLTYQFMNLDSLLNAQQNNNSVTEQLISPK